MKEDFHAPDNKIRWIDLESWERTFIFNNYLGTDFPYIIITSDIDVTKPLHFAKNNNISFNLVMVWLCNSVMDSIENYRYRFIDGRPFVIDHIRPFVNHLVPGSETFVISEGPWPCDDIIGFCTETHRRFESTDQEQSFANMSGQLDIVNYTSIPWIRYTGFVRTIKKDGVDNAPKISFGKYYEKDGRILMPVSSQSHHGLMDGYHVGLFFNRLQAACEETIK